MGLHVRREGRPARHWDLKRAVCDWETLARTLSEIRLPRKPSLRTTRLRAPVFRPEVRARSLKPSGASFAASLDWPSVWLLRQNPLCALP